ncbi:hypothetical protein CHU98_g3499 [Xylaria longipes]|nr:hypothetical protein CHU98_g3499 [Xylaria longipes]
MTVLALTHNDSHNVGLISRSSLFVPSILHMVPVFLLISIYWDECGQTCGNPISDRNAYTIWRIRKHDVVVALLRAWAKPMLRALRRACKLERPNSEILGNMATLGTQFGFGLLQSKL